MKGIILILLLICLVVFSQVYTNISSETFSVLKYEIGTDLNIYPRPSTLFTYLKITNITDTTLFFQTPSPNICYYRVTKGNYEVGFFPLVTLPMIGSFTLTPNESIADSSIWETTPAIWDTTYKIWGILNIATSWSSFPKDSHYVEFSIGSTDIAEENEGHMNSYSFQNPIRGALIIGCSGQYEVFDINGRRVKTTNGPSRVDVGNLAPGIYLLKREGTKTCQKITILR